MNQKLKFSKANSKLIKLQKATGKRVYSVSLLSGFCCPGALKCKAMAIKTHKGLRIKDGPEQEFRCFSASEEALFKNTYNQRKYNWELLRSKTKKEMVELIQLSLPKKAEIVRIHVGGDFINQDYFDAWNIIARLNPSIIFYAYTKSLLFWCRRLRDISPNLILTASRGGRYDWMIDFFRLKDAEVIWGDYVNKYNNKEIDHTDEHALGSESFYLMGHGVQRKGSEVSKLWNKEIRKRALAV